METVGTASEDEEGGGDDSLETKEEGSDLLIVPSSMLDGSSEDWGGALADSDGANCSLEADSSESDKTASKTDRVVSITSSLEQPLKEKTAISTAIKAANQRISFDLHKWFIRCFCPPDL